MFTRAGNHCYHRRRELFGQSNRVRIASWCVPEQLVVGKDVFAVLCSPRFQLAPITRPLFSDDPGLVKVALPDVRYPTIETAVCGSWCLQSTQRQHPFQEKSLQHRHVACRVVAVNMVRCLIFSRAASTVVTTCVLGCFWFLF